jgi:hypothetical protein
MKTILCGLVIALMMTGSGYAFEKFRDIEAVKLDDNGFAKEIPEQYCNWLKTKALRNVNLSMTAEFFTMEAYEKSIKPPYEDKKGDHSLETYESNILRFAKEAHYFAVTYSAFCDD